MITEEEFCLRVGIEHRTLWVWLDEGWLAPRRDDAGLVLSEMDAARARLIRDLRESLGVNDEGIGVILNLVDQVHGLRSVLQDLLERSSSADRSNGAGR
jgi:chaperone modulatory protein CbpM